MPILTVRGIQGWEKTTPIPNSPNYVMGVINLRGEVVPIIDLRKRFDLEMISYGAHTVVIVVSIEQSNKQITVGLVVDAVSDVYDMNEEDMRKTPEFGAAVDSSFVKGLGLIEEKMVIILEIDRLVDWQIVSEKDLLASTLKITESDAGNVSAEAEAA